MDIIFWIVGICIGVIVGRTTATQKLSDQDEKLLEEIKNLKEDVLYYKKLTRTLVEENTNLRKKVNE
jgi:uncharacterized membrane-anchored protein YhcB (DUF1043 family)